MPTFISAIIRVWTRPAATTPPPRITGSHFVEPDAASADEEQVQHIITWQYELQKMDQRKIKEGTIIRFDFRKAFFEPLVAFIFSLQHLEIHCTTTRPI